MKQKLIKTWEGINKNFEFIFPMILGILIVVILVTFAEFSLFVNTPFNATTWNVANNSSVNDILLVSIILLAVFFLLGLNTFNYQFYLTDLSADSSFSDEESKRGIKKCVRLNMLSIVFIGLWTVVFLCFVVLKWDYGYFSVLGDEPIIVFLNSSSVLALFIFFVFFLEDRALYLLALEQEKKDDYPTMEEKKKIRIEAMKRLSHDSYLFVDIPVFGSSILFFVFQWLSKNLTLVANGVTDTGYKIIQEMTATKVPIPYDPDLFIAAQNTLQLQYKIGLAGGSHIVQLLLSQLIFIILMVRYNNNISK